jgi:Tfp pilus assembly protein FimT
MKINRLSKRSFTIFEIVVVLVILSIIISLNLSNSNSVKPAHSNIDLAIAQLKIHLNLTRKIALEDDKFDEKNPLWFRARWTLKFRNCKNKSGIYYIVYSDKNGKGHPNKSESIKDPLTKKYLFSSYDCNPNQDESKYILLSKVYDIDRVVMSCNHTSSSSLGKISFGNDGRPYYKLSTKPNQAYKYALKKRCEIKLYSQDESRSLYIEAETGYVY